MKSGVPKFCDAEFVDHMTADQPLPPESVATKDPCPPPRPHGEVTTTHQPHWHSPMPNVLLVGKSVNWMKNDEDVQPQAENS